MAKLSSIDNFLMNSENNTNVLKRMRKELQETEAKFSKNDLEAKERLETDGWVEVGGYIFHPELAEKAKGLAEKVGEDTWYEFLSENLKVIKI